MIKKYKIGKLILQVEATVCFQETEKITRFYYDGGEPDYNIYVDFVADIADNTESPLYETADRLYFAENGAECCYYKSHEKKDRYYALRKNEGNIIRIRIDEKYRKMLRDDVIFSLSGIEELIIENNGCILHSSCVIYKNSAILFTGPCSIGKSTQAELWEKYADALIVNGDKILIENIDGEIHASGIPFSGSSKDCMNLSAPVRAIICLGKGKENSVKRLHAPQSFYSIYKNCYPVPFSKELTRSLMDVVSLISENIPVYEFYCLPDESAVEVLKTELF